MDRNSEGRPAVGLACNAATKEADVGAADLERLELFADFKFGEFDEPTSWDEPPPYDEVVEARLIDFSQDLDALVVCHGAPRVTAAVLDASPKLRLIGELEGDRFAQRIDVEAAKFRDIRSVDTTQGSSYPVAEWALAMMLVGLRNAGSLFRKIIAHERVLEDVSARESNPGYIRGELTNKTVGLIGCGHIGRRLLEFLHPFQVDVLVSDPYVPREFSDALGITLTSLDNVMSLADVVVCLAPITPATRGMIGTHEVELLKSGAVFVNVSRGAIVDSDALIRRLKRGDIIASLDVFEPEPIPIDSPVRDLDNVFLTPHIAGVTKESRKQFFSLMVNELELLFAGHETRYDLFPRTLANRRGELPPIT